MSQISAKDVAELRRKTGAGMMDCKKALEANGGDFEAATKWLREKGMADTAKRSDRDNSQGAVFAAGNDSASAVISLKSETDFVAKSPEFLALGQKIAEAVAGNGPEAAQGFAAEIDSLKVSLKENLGLGEIAYFSAPTGSVVDTYLHMQSGRGVNGVLVALDGGTVETAHEVALHIASQRPRWLTRDDVPNELIEAEREVLTNLSRNEGKPEAALPKIVEGRLGGFFKANCLVEQAFVKDPKMTIADLIGGASITKFSQIEVG